VLRAAELHRRSGFEPRWGAFPSYGCAPRADCCREVAGPLGAGRLVSDLIGLAQGVQRIVDGQKDWRFERAEGTAAADRQRNRGHRYVVGSLPQGVAVVRAEGVPKTVKLPPIDSMYDCAAFRRSSGLLISLAQVSGV
jgi:hypothetical protein